MPLSAFQKMIKTIALVLVLALALGVTIYGGKEAANYFAKASSCQVQKVEAVQVTANSAVISWETIEATQGRIEYGTDPANLSFQVPEGASGKIHNVPLTLLTPNTVYYYLIAIGNTRCDSTGQACQEKNCVPWSFTTSTVASLSPTSAKTAESTLSATLTPTLVATLSATPSSLLSDFCQNVKANLGKTSQEATIWATLKQYDIDGNGVINGLDVIKCQQKGR